MKYPVPPEYCLIVKAFSQASTLRGSAMLLGVDPAVLVRKVKMISQEFGFLEKVGNRWAVTDAGRRLAYWTEEAISSQTLLLYATPRLRISAFSWLIEEILIPEFDTLNETFKSKYEFSFRMVASNLEQELLSNRSDFVLHGQAPTDPAIAHKRIAAIPWVVIVPTSWRSKVAKLSPAELVHFLNQKPFCRHADLAPMTALGYNPSRVHSMIADSIIGLRSAVMNELGWTALPAMSVKSALKEKKVFKLNMKLDYKDDLSLWWMRSRKDSSGLSKQFATWIEIQNSKLSILGN